MMTQREMDDGRPSRPFKLFGIAREAMKRARLIQVRHGRIGVTTFMP
jgi:hypothetical protein